MSSALMPKQPKAALLQPRNGARIIQGLKLMLANSQNASDIGNL